MSPFNLFRFASDSCIVLFQPNNLFVAHGKKSNYAIMVLTIVHILLDEESKTYEMVFQSMVCGQNERAV